MSLMSRSAQVIQYLQVTNVIEDLNHERNDRLTQNLIYPSSV